MKRNRTPGSCLLMWLLVMPCAAAGQSDVGGREAEAVANQAFDAHARMEWRRLVLLIHPTALARMRTENLRMLHDMERSRSEPQPRDSTMPEAVARWFEQRRQEHFHIQDGAWSLAALGVASIQEAEALSLEEFMMRSLSAQDPRTMMMKQMKRLRPNVPDSVFRNEKFHPKRITVGSVVENDSVAHVLYRQRYEATDPTELVVAMLRRSQEGWRLWPSAGSELFGNGNFMVSVEVNDDIQEVEKLASETVTWEAGQVPAGRAWLVGFGKDTTATRALIVESNGQRVRVPLAVFEKLLELLSITHIVPR